MKPFRFFPFAHPLRAVFVVVLALSISVGCSFSFNAKKIEIPLICNAEDVSIRLECNPQRLFDSLSPEDKQIAKTRVCAVCAEFQRTRDLADRLSNDTSLPAPAREAWRATKVSYEQLTRQCREFEAKTGSCPHSP